MTDAAPALVPSPTLTIDDADNGGSDPGSWATAIAHTPGLRRQVEAEQDPNVND